MANVEIEPTPDGIIAKITWNEEDRLAIQGLLADKKATMSFCGLTKPKTNLWNIVGIIVIIGQVLIISYLILF